MKTEYVSVHKAVMVSKYKNCNICNAKKVIKDHFYCSKGTYRAECKACTIKKNVLYQQKNKTWQHRFVDDDCQRSYMSDYYSKNKEQFAEYGKNFRERNPEYHKLYARRKKDEDRNPSDKEN